MKKKVANKQKSKLMMKWNGKEITKKTLAKLIGLALIVIAAIILLVFILITIARLIKNPTDTFVVEEGTVSLEENATGYIIREEQVVQGENYKNGMEKLKAEGEKVAKGEAIFRYYTSGEEKIIKRIEELDKKLQEALENQNNLPSSDIKMLEKQIDSKIDDLYGVNDIQKLQEYKKDINTYVTKKAKIAGEKSPSGSYIRKLMDERNEYAKQLNSGSEYITAPMSGIVSYRVDGLENTLSPKDFSMLSASTLKNLNLKTGQIIATSEEAGKIIDNFKCYIATILSSEKAKQAVAGDKVTLRLSNSLETEGVIEYVSDEGEEGKLLVIRISNYVEELISYRKISLDVIWWSYTGLKIPNSAIVYENDLAYVVRNRAGYLDKILVNVKNQNEKYAIVVSYTPEELKDMNITTNSRKISLYDEILIHPDLSKAN